MSRSASREVSEEAPVSRPELTLEVLFETQARFVWRVLARLGIPNADLPDVSQEVFLTAHRMLATFEHRCSVSTWLYGISLRVAATHRRRLFRRREDVTAEPPEGTHQVTPLNAEAAVQRVRLERVLFDLPEEQANVFILYELEELTMSEVAAALGYPLQTAYSRLYAARKAVLVAFSERKKDLES